MIRILLATILFAPLVSSIHGQQDKTATSSIQFKATRFDPLDRKPPEFRIGHGSGQVALNIPLTHIAGPFKASLREGQFLDFWRENTEKPEFTVAIKEGERKNLLLGRVDKLII